MPTVIIDQALQKFTEFSHRNLREKLRSEKFEFALNIANFQKYRGGSQIYLEGFLAELAFSVDSCKI